MLWRVRIIMAPVKGLDVFESFNRFNTGKKVSESVWDYVTVPNNATAIKEKYDIHFGSRIIPEDENLVDRLFLAGIDMLATTGFYNPNLGKVMTITEDEIYGGLRTAPTKIKMGKGKDRVVCKSRQGSSKNKPIIQGGPTGAPVSEEIFSSMMQSYAQEKGVDSLVSGVLNTVNGNYSTTNTPWEIRATLAEIRYVRDACAMVGRQGMCI